MSQWLSHSDILLTTDQMGLLQKTDDKFIIYHNDKLYFDWKIPIPLKIPVTFFFQVDTSSKQSNKSTL